MPTRAPIKNKFFISFNLSAFFISFLFIVYLLLVSLGVGTKSAYADYIVFDKSDSHYHITVWASPNPISEGNVHLTVRLARPDSMGLGQEYPVRNAIMQLVFEQLDGVGADGNKPVAYTVHKPQTADETDPGTYEIHDALYAAGDYTAHLKISGSEGPATFDFPIKAIPQPDDRLFDAFLLGGIAILVLTIVLTYLRRPKEPNATSSPNTNQQPTASS